MEGKEDVQEDLGSADGRAHAAGSGSGGLFWGFAEFGDFAHFEWRVEEKKRGIGGEVELRMKIDRRRKRIIGWTG